MFPIFPICPICPIVALIVWPYCVALLWPSVDLDKIEPLDLLLLSHASGDDVHGLLPEAGQPPISKIAGCWI